MEEIVQDGSEPMTATERLRAMLDELNIKHFDFHKGGWTQTQWEAPDGNRHFTYETYDNPAKTAKLVISWFPTPEQAIEATLGRGECRNKARRPQTFWCDQCDCATESCVDVGGTLINGFRYCPWCGRAVRA